MTTLTLASITEYDIDRHCAACHGQREIDDMFAQAIAGLWHGGQGSALYALASTGHVQSDDHVSNILDEIAAARPTGIGHNLENLQLDMLATWVLNADRAEQSRAYIVDGIHITCRQCEGLYGPDDDVTPIRVDHGTRCDTCHTIINA